jgi:hypothetical protein
MWLLRMRLLNHEESCQNSARECDTRKLDALVQRDRSTACNGRLNFRQLNSQT